VGSAIECIVLVRQDPRHALEFGQKSTSSEILRSIVDGCLLFFISIEVWSTQHNPVSHEDCRDSLNSNGVSKRYKVYDHGQHAHIKSRRIESHHHHPPTSIDYLGCPKGQVQVSYQLGLPLQFHYVEKIQKTNESKARCATITDALDGTSTFFWHNSNAYYDRWISKPLLTAFALLVIGIEYDLIVEDMDVTASDVFTICSRGEEGILSSRIGLSKRV
jgi:hypothetical protein